MIRVVCIVCFLLMGGSIQAQHSFFVNKDGKKTIMKDEGVDILVIDKRLSYKEVGKTWDKYIRFKDLDYAKWGQYVFKVIRVGKSKKERGFFMQAESKTHKLLTVAVTVTNTRGSGFSTSYVVYEVIVTDKDYNIIEELSFKSFKSDTDKREMVGPMIRKYFSECEAVMGALEATGTDAKGIQDYLADPEYINCQ